MLASRQPPARWPFWLLLVAWICANSPQAAVYAVLTWASEARHFSHQRSLTLKVAQILTGEKPSNEARLAKNETLPAKRQPVVPAGAVLKKIELAAEHTMDLLPPALRAAQPDTAERMIPDLLRAPPPHEPPRERWV